MKIAAVWLAGLVSLSLAGCNSQTQSGEQGALASTPSGFYEAKELEPYRTRYSARIVENWKEVIQPLLDAEEQESLRNVRFEFDVGKPNDVFQFYALGDTIHMSANSLKIVDDLTLGWIWLDKNGHKTATINEYLAILRYRGKDEGLFVPANQPLAVLGVPKDAYDDPAVRSQFDLVYAQIIFFIMCHELGHVRYRHRGNSTDTEAAARQSIRDEMEADAFALEIMRRIREPPLAINLLFSFFASSEPAPAEPGYGRLGSHPLASNRLRQIAATMRQNAPDYANGFPNPSEGVATLHSLAAQIETDIIPVLESGTVKQLWRQKGLSGRFADLKAGQIVGRGQNRAGSASAEGQVFDGAYSGTWVDAKGVDLPVQMQLQRNGTRVVGRYQFGGNDSSLEGVVTGERLDFEWKFGADYFGRGTLNVAPNGQLDGTWGYTTNSEGGGRWALHPIE